MFDAGDAHGRMPGYCVQTVKDTERPQRPDYPVM